MEETLVLLVNIIDIAAIRTANYALTMVILFKDNIVKEKFPITEQFAINK